jgi:glycosyltransferase involved in cell wall biosynthesis
MVGVVAGRAVGRPVLLTRHHADEMRFIGRQAHVYADRLSARAATRIISVSESQRRYLVAAEGVDPAKIDLVRLGFAFERLVPVPGEVRRVRSEFGLEGHFVIGMVARFSQTKGHHVLLKAARALRGSIGSLRVLLVGGGDLPKLRALARAEGVDDVTVIAGHRTDVVACLGAMDLVASPSVSESFCQVIVEAMGAGRPVITTGVGVAPEVIDDRNTGWLIPPGDARAIVEAVRHLHGDAQLRASVAEAGQRSVRERFPVSRMVTSQIAVYNSVLDPTRQGH